MQDNIGNVGIIGCGNIAGIYLENLKKLPGMKVVAVADIKAEAALAKAKEYGVPKALSVAELLNDPEVGIVLNLTIPAVHAEVTLAALKAGKHVYSEKPVALSLSEAADIVALAASKGLKVASAPDTFMGASLQTCRAVIDDGLIGRPVAATGFMMYHGPDSWHPNPEFFFKRGAGPMLDMGPYYLTALVSLLGPAKRVSGSASIGQAEREITSEPLKGGKIIPDTPTHLTGSVDFESGVTATLLTSFDVWHHSHLPLEIYGTEGSLQVPDPNNFGGKVMLQRHDEKEWREIPLEHAWAMNSRGLGVADLADAVREGREPRAGLSMANHVLELMLAFEASSLAGRHIEIKTRCARPEPLPKSSFGGTPE